MARLFLTGLLMLAAFGAGYLVGGREQRSVQHNLQQLKDEMARRTLELERHVTAARMRGHLLEMRDALTTAQTQIEHQNFGLALGSLAEAQRSLHTALKLDETGALTRLQPVEQELERLQSAKHPLGRSAITAIERIKQQIIPGDESP
jgi:gamma-glutamyl phosphate reductase